MTSDDPAGVPVAPDAPSWAPGAPGAAVAGDGPVHVAADGGATRTPTGDAVAQIRDAVESVDQLPVHERVATFERANDVLARELAVLDEV